MRNTLLKSAHNSATQSTKSAIVIMMISLLLIILSSLLLFFFSPAPLYSQAADDDRDWLLLPRMPESLADPALSVVGDTIHIAGGFSGMGPTTAHFSFDPAQMRWTPLAPLPVPRGNATAATVDGKLYVIGGYNSDWGGALSYNHRYDPASGQWFTATATLFPASGAGSAAVDGEILLFGGFDNHTESTTVQRYSPSTDTWRLGTPMPLGRSEFSAVTVDDLVYIIGGNVLSITASSTITPVMTALPSTLVSVYDPQQDSWSELAPLPEGRLAYAAAARDNQIYVIGGLNKWVDGTIQRSVLVYDIATDRWSHGPALPMVRSGLRGAAFDGNIYIFGGYGENGYIYATTATFGPIGSKLHLPLVTRGQ